MSFTINNLLKRYYPAISLLSLVFMAVALDGAHRVGCYPTDSSKISQNFLYGEVKLNSIFVHKNNDPGRTDSVYVLVTVFYEDGSVVSTHPHPLGLSTKTWQVNRGANSLQSYNLYDGPIKGKTRVFLRIMESDSGIALTPWGPIPNGDEVLGDFFVEFQPTGGGVTVNYLCSKDCELRDTDPQGGRNVAVKGSGAEHHLNLRTVTGKVGVERAVLVAGTPPETGYFPCVFNKPCTTDNCYVQVKKYVRRRPTDRVAIAKPSESVTVARGSMPEQWASALILACAKSNVICHAEGARVRIYVTGENASPKFIRSPANAASCEGTVTAINNPAKDFLTSPHDYLTSALKGSE